jgi:pectate lyase
MTKKLSPASTAHAPSDADEQWTIVQVASYMSLSYQDARNAMLAGEFGESDYDAKSRRLTVRASHVRDARAKRDARRQSRRKTKRARRTR